MQERQSIPLTLKARIPKSFYSDWEQFTFTRLGQVGLGLAPGVLALGPLSFALVRAGRESSSPPTSLYLCAGANVLRSKTCNKGGYLHMSNPSPSIPDS